MKNNPNHFSMVLLVFAACTSLSNPAQEARTEPVSDKAFIQSSDASLIAALRLRKPSSSNSLEQVVKETEQRLDGVSGFSTPVWVCDGCGTSSHPSLGIIVDVLQLAAIRKQSHVQEFPSIVTFLLAHEKTHQYQYREYTPSIIDRPEEDRQAYEAQADILGAKYLIETIDGLATQQQTEAILEALRVAYDLGVEQYAIADHPSQEGRLTAVRLGMAAGMVVKMEQLGGPLGQASANVLISKLNIQQGENALQWSLRTATRIVNYRRPDIVDLVLTDEKTNYSSDSNGPVASYQLTYENRGDQTISIDMEVQCAAVPRQNPDDIIHWLKIDANSFSFALGPKSKRSLTGTMHCSETPELMPRVIAPPSPAALVKAEHSSAGISPPDAKSGSGLGIASRAGVRQGLGYTLSRILGTANDGFLTLRAGPGRKEDDVVMYPASPQFPGALDTEVSIPEPGSKKEPCLTALMVNTTEQQSADEEYESLTVNIRQQLGSLGKWSEIAGRDNARGSRYDSFELGRVRVVVEERSAGGNQRNYEVAVKVTASMHG